MGEVAEGGGGFERGDRYDPADDPLGHLEGDARQRVMASMTMGEVRRLEKERVRREEERRKKMGRERDEGGRRRWLR